MGGDGVRTMELSGTANHCTSRGRYERGNHRQLPQFASTGQVEQPFDINAQGLAETRAESTDG